MHRDDYLSSEKQMWEVKLLGYMGVGHPSSTGAIDEMICYLNAQKVWRSGN